MISPLGWYQIKLFLAHAGGIDMDTLHVFAGILLQFGMALALRVPVTRWIPWLAVLAVASVNEWIDLRLEKWPEPGMQYGAAVKDIVLTMSLPTVMLMVGRVRPQLLVGSPADIHSSSALAERALGRRAR